MDLKEIVERYKKTAGGFGKSVALAALGISREETERAFDMLDEDYHISRYIHFANASAAPPICKTRRRVSINFPIRTVTYWCR